MNLAFKLNLIFLMVGIGYAKVSHNKSVSAMQNGTALLDCNTGGKEFWWSDSSNRIIRNKPGKYTIFNNGTLKVEKVSRLDVGVYKCKVRDISTSTIFAKLLIDTETIVSRVHSNVTMTCKAEVPSDQQIIYAEYKFYVFNSNGKRILLSENGKMTEQGKEFGHGKLRTSERVLQVHKIETRNQGKFLCTVRWKSESDMGHAEYFFNVEVQGKTPPSTPAWPTKDHGRKTEEGAETKRNIQSCGEMKKNIWPLTALMTVVALKAVVKSRALGQT